nr:DUF1571 domain-containing protein [Rhodopirellula sp. SM50]
MTVRTTVTIILLISTSALVHAEPPHAATAGRSSLLTATAESADSHPLLPCLELAREGFERIEQEIRDYTCVLEKREWIDGKLTGPERIFAKVRHERSDDDQMVTPFGVYMKFLEPEGVAGREILFVKQSDQSKMLVRKGGKRFAFLTVSLDPTSRMAMLGNRYPITEFGIKRLVQRMIDLGTKELAYQECKVDIRSSLDVADHQHACTCIEVTHPIKRDPFQYHIARIYLDEVLNVPVRFESYDWPSEGSDQPVLHEEYIYRDLKLNVALSDEEFESDYSTYKFR